MVTIRFGMKLLLSTELYNHPLYLNLLLEVRVDLTILCKSINSEDIKEQLKWAINGIDIVGCGLSQDISRKLKEK